MIQNLLVYLIGTLVAVWILYKVIRSFRGKNNNPCNGCCGCDSMGYQKPGQKNQQIACPSGVQPLKKSNSKPKKKEEAIAESKK